MLKSRFLFGTVMMLAPQGKTVIAGGGAKHNRRNRSFLEHIAPTGRHNAFVNSFAPMGR